MKRSLCVLVLATACGAPGPAPNNDNGEVDLPLGDRLADDPKADGNWGAALTCKVAPVLPSLVSPRITISLNGLTLHLVDPATGYDKVFPVGVGTINTDKTSANFGESETYEPLLGGKQDYAITPSSIQTCKSWWTDPDTGAQSPVFAGLPFMSWDGPYAVHGPIDNFTAPNGGNLRRGFVSHGCVRMEAADVLEVYARIKSVAKTPVHIQREPERLADGTRTNIPQKWVGAECGADSDCNFAGGICVKNKYSERSYCTMTCTGLCPDQAGQPGTFCVADPNDATRGLCVAKMVGQDQDCRNYDHFITKTVSRFKQSVKAAVCMPGSPGWVGDHCFAAADCLNGTTCLGASSSKAGICTESCAKFCPDEVGFPSTFCADDPVGKTCLRTCTPASNASECPADSQCVQRHRVSDTATVKYVCDPV